MLCDNAGRPVNGPRNWGSGIMPASHQGVRINSGDEPIANLSLPEGHSLERQQDELSLLNAFNRDHAETRQQNSELEARIRSYELAFRLHAKAPEAVDLNQEPELVDAFRSPPAPVESFVFPPERVK